MASWNLTSWMLAGCVCQQDSTFPAAVIGSLIKIIIERSTNLDSSYIHKQNSDETLNLTKNHPTQTISLDLKASFIKHKQKSLSYLGKTIPKHFSLRHICFYVYVKLLFFYSLSLHIFYEDTKRNHPQSHVYTPSSSTQNWRKLNCVYMRGN